MLPREILSGINKADHQSARAHIVFSHSAKLDAFNAAVFRRAMNHPAAKVLQKIASITSRIPLPKALHQFLGREPWVLDAAGMPIPPERLASVQPDDQFLLSYPRSGNTWVRNLLRNVFILRSPELPEPIIWELLPDIHVPEHPLNHPVVQQFKLPSRILKSHNIRDLGPCRLVYIVRQPADSLVSYYHYHRLQEKTLPLVAEGIDAFCRAMVDGWIEHVEHALRIQRERPSDTLLLSYEGLSADTVSQLRRITEFLNVKVSDDLLSAAVEKSSFSRLRSQEESRRGTSEEYFFRKGRTDSAKEELTEETLRFVTGRAMRTYENAIAAIHSSQDRTA